MSNATDRDHSVALQPAQTPSDSLCQKCPLRGQAREAPARSHYLLGTGSSLRSQLCPPGSPQSLSPGGGKAWRGRWEPNEAA
jgi:hypothetical protein